jgi:5-oxopent-3-ene-1,2,5-tricarboxylate decarboxylase / 2-hydroxyhepta-2,4-diene-1,7-dioate isomerase
MSTAFMPSGTVYGTLLNFRAESERLAPHMPEAPYKGAPKAPVLYIKPANTWSRSSASIAVPSRVPQVEIGATIGMVIGPFRQSNHANAAMPSVASIVLMNDLSIPHQSFFRPPVKFKCLDGFLGIGANTLGAKQAGDPSHIVLEVRVNGRLRQRLDFATLVRPAAQLIADVREFMSLHPGDVLTLGCDIAPEGTRPLAKVGDLIEISAPGLPGLGKLSNTLVAEAQP